MRKPVFKIERPEGVKFDLHPVALQRWEPVAAKESDEPTISILDPIGEDWTGNGVTAKRITAALRNIGDKPVTVQINSPGGDFFEGLAIYNALAQHPDIVTVQVLGIAASAASVIAMAGDRIEIAKAGFFMIHNTQWIAIGDRHVMTETAGVMERFDEVAAELYADRTGLEAKAVGKLMDAETWLGGKAAVEQGFATDLLGFEPEKAKNALKSLYRIEQHLVRAGVPRAERRALMADAQKELGKPSAAHDDVTPRADDLDGSSFLKALRNFQVR